jgi:hypothetical protein
MEQSKSEYESYYSDDPSQPKNQPDQPAAEEAKSSYEESSYEFESCEEGSGDDANLKQYQNENLEVQDFS